MQKCKKIFYKQVDNTKKIRYNITEERKGVLV